MNNTTLSNQLQTNGKNALPQHYSDDEFTELVLKASPDILACIKNKFPHFYKSLIGIGFCINNHMLYVNMQDTEY